MQLAEYDLNIIHNLCAGPHKSNSDEQLSEKSKDSFHVNLRKLNLKTLFNA